MSADRSLGPQRMTSPLFKGCKTAPGHMLAASNGNLVLLLPTRCQSYRVGLGAHRQQLLLIDSTTERPQSHRRSTRRRNFRMDSGKPAISATECLPIPPTCILSFRGSDATSFRLCSQS